MSFEAKLIVCAVVLAVVLPMGWMVLRRILRGETFEKTGKAGTQLPPSGPPLDGGGV